MKPEYRLRDDWENVDGALLDGSDGAGELVAGGNLEHGVLLLFWRPRPMRVPADILSRAVASLRARVAGRVPLGATDSSYYTVVPLALCHSTADARFHVPFRTIPYHYVPLYSTSSVPTT